MPAYYYSKRITIPAGESVKLSVEFPDNGTAAEHRIDVFHGLDLDEFNEFERDMGTAASFGGQFELSSKAFNLDHAQAEVRINVSVNGRLIQRCKVLKSADAAPLFKIAVKF